MFGAFIVVTRKEATAYCSAAPGQWLREGSPRLGLAGGRSLSVELRAQHHGAARGSCCRVSDARAAAQAQGAGALSDSPNRGWKTPAAGPESLPSLKMAAADFLHQMQNGSLSSSKMATGGVRVLLPIGFKRPLFKMASRNILGSLPSLKKAASGVFATS